ncbi:MAG: acetoin utilization protein AcuC, partial [Nitrososphaerota archaeon]
MAEDRLLVAFGDELFSYDFGPYHPLNRSRTELFVRRLMELKERAPEKIELVEPAMATEDELTLFHTREYVEFVK